MRRNSFNCTNKDNELGTISKGSLRNSIVTQNVFWSSPLNRFVSKIPEKNLVCNLDISIILQVRIKKSLYGIFLILPQKRKNFRFLVITVFPKSSLRTELMFSELYNNIGKSKCWTFRRMKAFLMNFQPWARLTLNSQHNWYFLLLFCVTP